MTSHRLTLDRYLDVLAEDGEHLAYALESRAFTAPVEACPEWSLADLGYHVGDVIRFWNWVVTTGATTTDGEPEFARPGDVELADWLRRGIEQLLVTLRGADPAAPAYSWTPQQDVAFVQRRVPHEVAVHRWDAQHAARHVTGVAAQPVEADLAADGVSEFFLLASSWPITTSLGSDARVNLRAVDTGAVWTSWIEGSNLRWVNGVEPGEAAVTLSGPASELLLVLWRRIPLDGSQVTIAGDADAAREFVALASLD